jgi:hypothetical protein
MDKIRLPFHGSDGTGHRLVAIGLAAGALIAALAALGFFSVVWFLTHSD